MRSDFYLNIGTYLQQKRTKPLIVPPPARGQYVVLKLFRVTDAAFSTPATYICVCLLGVFLPFILDVRLVDVPAGVTQEVGHTGSLSHLPSAVLALMFLAKKIQPFLFLVDRDVKFYVLTI